MTNFPLLPQWLDLATQAAWQGGAILKQFWGNLSEIKEKGFPGDLVTEADQQSEKVILDWLLHYFPDHQILAEESGLLEHQSEFIWAIDPLDGTTNYAHQYPMAAVSIGLIYQHEPILGIIYNPFTEELYQAAKGMGATLNQYPIHVSPILDLNRSLLATGFAYDRRETADNNYAEFCHFTHLTQGVRRAGAASLDLAYVACGRLDGYWERGLKPWDIAAGAILVQEAGGQVSDYKLGKLDLESGRILATNGHLQTVMSHELTEVEKQRTNGFFNKCSIERKPS
jgi:myo-inositol-1(or 4)-monophosphatase